MIDLYTARTPNGQKASIALEELGVEYRVNALDLGAKEQKAPEFLSVNPNGRIPAIVDRDNHDFAVFESGAILVYLAEKTGRLIPIDPNGRSKALQWVMFQMGGIGPMQGQAHVFFRYAPERIPYAIQRYQNETMRLYRVLEEALNDKHYLIGDYSIADIASFPWVRAYEGAGLDLEDLPNVRAWLARIEERPAVQRGLEIPPAAQATKEASLSAARSILEPASGSPQH